MNNLKAKSFLTKSMQLLVDTPNELIDEFYNICKLTVIKKGKLFLMAGDTPQYMGFNLNGIFRLYYIDNNGNDLAKGFSTAGKFVVSYSALVQKRPSYFYIEAMIDSEILKFRYSEWVQLIEKDMRWYPFIFKLVQSVYIMIEMREKSFFLDDATIRYLEFRKNYPSLENNIKWYHIASFLGITPEALSRIRKKLKLI